MSLFISSRLLGRGSLTLVTRQPLRHVPTSSVSDKHVVVKFGRRTFLNRPKRRLPPQQTVRKPLTPKQGRTHPTPKQQGWGDSFIDRGPIPRLFYSRHESTILKPQFSGASTYAGLLGLTGVNLVVFFMWNMEDDSDNDEWMLANFSTNLTNFSEGRIWTLATASISHQDFMHLFGNMFAMWLFGFPTFRVIGPVAFTGLYLVGGVACSSTHLLHNILTGKTNAPLSKDEIHAIEELAQANQGELPPLVAERVATADQPSLGASGSVMAISVAAAALFPLDRVRVHLRGFFLPLPAAVAIFVGSDLLGLTNAGSPVDHAGHLGGLFMGAAYVYYAWYSKSGIFGILHALPTGGQLPIIFRYKQWLRSRRSNM
eukprot:CAMPEP_0198286784 /NCGR_PEP_ID=MMETSP1449-20131203/5763_1 /TAXON_ID=420275 /ORGANISM="Attheya septentrionalis, Strain CCMP2084" /LENGTH=371 /DNA_ID=CAMNT_0043984585 /DNA_START=31 /DNA_END=1146 /DNA_ORIENTATION=+